MLHTWFKRILFSVNNFFCLNYRIVIPYYPNTPPRNGNTIGNFFRSIIFWRVIKYTFDFFQFIHDYPLLVKCIYKADDICRIYCLFRSYKIIHCCN